jgi:hypothetical protein
MWKALISLIIFGSAGYWFVNEFVLKQSAKPPIEEKAKESETVEKYRDEVNKALDRQNERLKNLNPENHTTK